MESTRQQKVARLLQKELAAVLQTEGRNIYGSAMLTVTRVEVSKDLSFAKVYLSVFATDDKPYVIERMENNKKELRFRLGQHIRNQLRIVPELAFIQDDTLDYIENIDNLLKK
ncbi:MAG: 30S ribosome-binding factor RbfA [Bacteroidales bacterium]|jgi:ribosome-binding factor A|nr:30S ribosome-binding factor RbfA [Bacteroidales bacterium]